MRLGLLIIFLCSLFQISAHAQSEINLRIENSTSDTVIINIGPIADPESGKMDTLYLKNGTVKYTFNIKEASQVVIIPMELIHIFKNGVKKPLPGSRIICYVSQNESLSIDAKIQDKVIIYKVKGNKFSEQLADARESKIDVFSTRYNFEAAYNEKKKSENSSEEEKKYMAAIGANNLAYQTANLQYAKSHLDSEASSYLLLEVVAKDSVALLYPKLSQNV